MYIKRKNIKKYIYILGLYLFFRLIFVVYSDLVDLSRFQLSL